MHQAPEYHSHEEFNNRLAKLATIKNAQIDPYPPKFTPSHHAQPLHDTYAEQPVGHSEEAGNGTTPPVSVAGRLVLFRAMGKNAFGHIQDSTGRIQVMFNRDLSKVEGYHPENGSEEALSHNKFIEKLIDLGDFIGIQGHLFRTNKGELTIFVKEVSLLCKTLLPLPEKHAGLVDKELRYRKRWLDLITHQEVRDTFLQRSRIVQIIRRFFEDNAFLEVETPVLQNVYGGAAARPFTTHLNALDQEMFLRISLEIPLKKLIVGGMERVFEMGKVFRNEGIDRNHNPEFTELEAYASYWDYNDMMNLAEKLFEAIALKLFNTTKVLHGEQTIDFKAPWTRLTMKESILKYTKLDVDAMGTDELRKILLDDGVIDPKAILNASKGLLITMLFEEKVEQYLIQPHHITDHPIETTPLCKLHRDPEQRREGIVERFESYVCGQEICNSYTELNDPVLQRQLLLEQAARREAGDEEANPLDEEFIESICQGMPPASGIGMGVDRIVMLFTNALSIRDVVYFPLVRG